MPTVQELIDALAPQGATRGIRLEPNVQNEVADLAPIDANPLGVIEAPEMTRPNWIV